MIKMINKITGTDMYVDESRLTEYLMAGHKVAEKIKDPAATLPGVKKEKKENETVSTLKKTISKVKTTRGKKG